MVELTKSNFLNHVLNNYDQHSLSETVKQYKNLVTSHIDVCIYNSIVTDEKDQFPNTNPIDIRNYHDEIISKLVSGYGKTKTAYSEFLRAFEKLMYRLFNDGDSVLNGPYSAINFYLAKYDGDRKFNMSESDFGFIGFDIYKDSDGNEINEDKRYSVESAFNNIIMCLFDSDKFSPDQLDIISNRYNHTNQSKNYVSYASKWIDSVVFMLDQLTDEIKGVGNSQFEDCQNYYKNNLEYVYPRIYKYFSQNYNIYDWNADSYSSDCECFYITNPYAYINIQVNYYCADHVINIEFDNYNYNNGIRVKINHHSDISKEDSILNEIIAIYFDIMKHNDITNLTIEQYSRYYYNLKSHIQQFKIILVHEEKDFNNKTIIKEDKTIYEGLIGKFINDDNKDYIVVDSNKIIDNSLDTSTITLRVKKPN